MYQDVPSWFLALACISSWPGFTRKTPRVFGWSTNLCTGISQFQLQTAECDLIRCSVSAAKIPTTTDLINIMNILQDLKRTWNDAILHFSWNQSFDHTISRTTTGFLLFGQGRKIQYTVLQCNSSHIIVQSYLPILSCLKSPQKWLVPLDDLAGASQVQSCNPLQPYIDIGTLHFPGLKKSCRSQNETTWKHSAELSASGCRKWVWPAHVTSLRWSTR